MANTRKIYACNYCKLTDIESLPCVVVSESFTVSFPPPPGLTPAPRVSSMLPEMFTWTLQCSAVYIDVITNIAPPFPIASCTIGCSVFTWSFLDEQLVRRSVETWVTFPKSAVMFSFFCSSTLSLAFKLRSASRRFSSVSRLTCTVAELDPLPRSNIKLLAVAIFSGGSSACVLRRLEIDHPVNDSSCLRHGVNRFGFLE